MSNTNSFVLFGRAFKNAKKDFWVSIQVLFWITLAMTFVFYFVEHEAQPQEYRDIFDAFLWAVTRYIGDPGDFAGHDPITITGRTIYTLIGILKILIFAVPAGLVANGFRKAMEEEKRKVYMENIRKRILKAFRRNTSVTFDEYRNGCLDIPDHSYFFTPRKVSVTQLEVKGIKLSDIIDAVNKFPEFRLKNLASAISIESHPDDRLVVEHFPLNTDYGCCINRNSNITIVAPSSVAEIGIGWFAYHLSKFGGFNLITKELEVDPDEPDSFAAMPSKIKVDGMTKEELKVSSKENKEKLALIEMKRERREQFLNDLQSLCNGENTWCIVLNSHVKNGSCTEEFHFAHSLKDGSNSTVCDFDAYMKMFREFRNEMHDEFSITAIQSERFPLKKSYLPYRVRKNNAATNAFSIRVSSDIVCFDARSHAIMYRMANVLNKTLNGQGILPVDDDDFKERIFGYKLNK